MCIFVVISPSTISILFSEPITILALTVYGPFHNALGTGLVAVCQTQNVVLCTHMKRLLQSMWHWQEEWVNGVKWLLHKLVSHTHHWHKKPAAEVHTYYLTTRDWEEISGPPELTVQPISLVISRISERPHLKNEGKIPTAKHWLPHKHIQPHKHKDTKTFK